MFRLILHFMFQKEIYPNTVSNGNTDVHQKIINQLTMDVTMHSSFLERQGGTSVQYP